MSSDVSDETNMGGVVYHYQNINGEKRNTNQMLKSDDQDAVDRYKQSRVSQWVDEHFKQDTVTKKTITRITEFELDRLENIAKTHNLKFDKNFYLSSLNTFDKELIVPDNIMSFYKNLPEKNIENSNRRYFIRDQTGKYLKLVKIDLCTYKKTQILMENNILNPSGI